MTPARERTEYRVRAELGVAVPEVEALLLAAHTLEAALAALTSDAPEQKIREAGSIARSSTLQISANLLRVSAAAERLLLLVDLAEVGEGELSE